MIDVFPMVIFSFHFANKRKENNFATTTHMKTNFCRGFCCTLKSQNNDKKVHISTHCAIFFPIFFYLLYDRYVYNMTVTLQLSHATTDDNESKSCNYRGIMCTKMCMKPKRFN